MKKTKKWVRNIHKFYLWFFRLFFSMKMRRVYHLKYDKYKLGKDENVLILSNHQTEDDQFIVSLMFNKPVYWVATDTMYSSKFLAKLFGHLVAPILKEKGVADLSTIKTLLQVSKEKGTIGLFPEGNRSYGEFQFNIDDSTVKLIKKLNMPIVFVNLIGGFGISPRFSSIKRKGTMEARIVEKLSVEEIKNYYDEDLLNHIKDRLRKYDSESGKTFESDRRAENLEEMLFVCPKCNSMNTIYSKGNYVYCSKCGLKVEYTNRLSLENSDTNFKFHRLVDWYDFQRKYVKELELKDDLIFEDNDVKLYFVKPNYNRKLLTKNNIKLYKDKLVFDDKLEFKVEDIIIASPVAGTKLSINIANHKYVIKGGKSFNPLKYTLMFNKLDTKMSKIDKYYSL